ncbi:hypothetical protein MUK42_25230 [Musa troglodytarum]|uniref:Uncharacterized protein n=1 Tax=Musa troglodytarum TaxID=320322 RepID=A0A9E7L4F0_9LILI|nr:hypothetical protein MUK42_25230 [Musa troglodytarum]
MKLRTASGFSVDRRCARGLENLAASEGENPQEFSRYCTMKWGSGDMVPPTAAAASTEEEKKRRSRRRQVSNKGRRLLRRSTERSVEAAIVAQESSRSGTLITTTLLICRLLLLRQSGKCGFCEFVIKSAPFSSFFELD